MNAPAPSPREAAGLVRARLGREPQDMLEAAVVLEAWGGLRPELALATGRAVVARRRPEPMPSISARLAHNDRPPARLGEGTAFLITILAIACWAAPMSAAAGRPAVQDALTIALPSTLALQWGLRSRYLNGSAEPRRQLAARRRTVSAIGVLLGTATVAALGTAGLIGALLVATWTAGALLILSRRAPTYVATVVLATIAMVGGAPAVPVLAAAAALTCWAAMRLLAAEDRPRREPDAGRWPRAAAAATIGGGLGVLLVADTSLHWGTATPLMLIPATAASFWAGPRLWAVHETVPACLRGRVAAPARHAIAPSWPALALVGGAIARLVAGTALLSAPLVLAGSGSVSPGVLVGFGLMALLSLLVSFMESVGRPAAALLGVWLGASAAIAGSYAAAAPFPGAALVAGAALALIAAIPAVLILLARPERVLATSLWVA